MDKLVNSCCLLFFVAVSGQANCGERGPEQYTVYRNITYAKRDQAELKLDVFVPKGKGPFPAVMLVHGGAWRIGSRLQMLHHGVTLAERGYVALTIDYRLAPKHKFPSQIDDCRDALRWIRRHAETYNVDTNRVGAAGYSAGAHLVCLLAVTGKPTNKNSGGVDTLLRAVVAGAAPCEFLTVPEDSRRYAYWLGGTRKEVSEAYRKASPLVHVNERAPPVFFYNGTEDRIVPISLTLPMYEALKQLGVETELYKVQGAGHLTAFLNPTAIERACEFLDRHLK